MSVSSTVRAVYGVFLLVLAGSAGACSGGRDADAAIGTSTGAGVVSWRPATRTEFLAMPDSARLGRADNDGTFGTERGVAVELDLRLDGREGKGVPLAYTLHDARNDLPFVSHTLPVTPDAPKWRKRAYVWLPVPSPGTYYVRVMLNDSTGRKTDGPRTQDFTIE